MLYVACYKWFWLQEVRVDKPVEPRGHDGVYQYPRFSSHSDDFLALPYQQSFGLVSIITKICNISS